MATARVRLNDTEMRNLLQGPNGPVVQHVTRLCRRVTNQAKRNCKVDEGTLRASITYAVLPSPNSVLGRVGTPLIYGLYLHEGTGVYGPKARPITPIRRQFLRFEVKSGTSAVGRRPLVFARSVRGVPPDKFLLRALESVVPYPVRPGSPQ